MGNRGDGYVYIARAWLPEHGFVIKIGGTADLDSRLLQIGRDIRSFFYPRETERAFSTHSHSFWRDRVELVYWIDCLSWSRVERYLHQRYKPFAATVKPPYSRREFFKGEIFDLTEEQIEEIRNIDFLTNEEAICAEYDTWEPGSILISGDLHRRVEDYRSRANTRVQNRDRITSQHVVDAAIRFYLAHNPIQTAGLGREQLGDWGPDEQTRRERAHRRRFDDR